MNINEYIENIEATIPVTNITDILNMDGEPRDKAVYHNGVRDAIQVIKLLKTCDKLTIENLRSMKSRTTILPPDRPTPWQVGYNTCLEQAEKIVRR